MQLPFATDLLPDWTSFQRASRDGKPTGKWHATGTCLGESMVTRAMTKYQAERHAAKMNQNAQEAFWGNVAVLLERSNRLAALKAERRARAAQQGSLSL